MTIFERTTRVAGHKRLLRNVVNSVNTFCCAYYWGVVGTFRQHEGSDGAPSDQDNVISLA